MRAVQQFSLHGGYLKPCLHDTFESCSDGVVGENTSIEQFNAEEGNLQNGFGYHLIGTLGQQIGKLLLG